METIKLDFSRYTDKDADTSMKIQISGTGDLFRRSVNMVREILRIAREEDEEDLTDPV